MHGYYIHTYYQLLGRYIKLIYSCIHTFACGAYVVSVDSFILFKIYTFIQVGYVN